jgi:hypothetical protein
VWWQADQPVHAIGLAVRVASGAPDQTPIHGDVELF